jgi:ribosomal protein S27AE
MICPRQQVNQRCAYLLEVGKLTREKDACPKCGRFKLVNRRRRLIFPRASDFATAL